jgi:hypothetical protein
MAQLIRFGSPRAQRVRSLDEVERDRRRLDPLPNPEEAMLDQLDRRDRLRLVKFVCSFAWADFEVQPEERVFIGRLMRRLELGEDEDLKVQQWLDRPPRLEGLDPTSIPASHRRVFVDAIEGLIEADGEVADEERESFEIFKQLLAD